MPPSGPPAAAPDQLGCALDLTLVGIAFLDHSHGKAVCAENEIDLRGSGESRQRAIDSLDDGVDVSGVLVKLVHYVHAGTPAVRTKPARPLVEATPGGCLRVLRVQRQQDQIGR